MRSRSWSWSPAWPVAVLRGGAGQAFMTEGVEVVITFIAQWKDRAVGDVDTDCTPKVAAQFVNAGLAVYGRIETPPATKAIDAPPMDKAMKRPQVRRKGKRRNHVSRT